MLTSESWFSLVEKQHPDSEAAGYFWIVVRIFVKWIEHQLWYCVQGIEQHLFGRTAEEGRRHLDPFDLEKHRIFVLISSDGFVRQENIDRLSPDTISKWKVLEESPYNVICGNIKTNILLISISIIHSN